MLPINFGANTLLILSAHDPDAADDASVLEKVRGVLQRSDLRVSIVVESGADDDAGDDPKGKEQNLIPLPARSNRITNSLDALAAGRPSPPILHCPHLHWLSPAPSLSPLTGFTTLPRKGNRSHNNNMPLSLLRRLPHPHHPLPPHRFRLLFMLISLILGLRIHLQVLSCTPPFKLCLKPLPSLLPVVRVIPCPSAL